MDYFPGTESGFGAESSSKADLAPPDASDDEDGGLGDNTVCTVCCNPNKLLGSPAAVCSFCNHCEQIIPLGWTYYGHVHPMVIRPGQPTKMTDICEFCYLGLQKKPAAEYTRKRSRSDTTQALDQLSYRRGDLHRSEGKSPDILILLSAFEKRIVEQGKEPMCNCDFCGQAYHNRCVLYSKDVYGEIPPMCTNEKCRARWEKLDKPSHFAPSIRNRAQSLPRAPVTDFIERYLSAKVQRAKVLVRLVSNVNRFQESTPGYTKQYGKIRFPYQLKHILCFIECDDGTDLCFLSLVVAEFGPDCPEPNKNKAYISYIDSAQVYHSADCSLRKERDCGAECSPSTECPKERKEVVQGVLLGYMDWVKLRKFKQIYIWAMPPSDSTHDYIFHMRPLDQHCPTPDQLDKWYRSLLDKAKETGIITAFHDNAKPDPDTRSPRPLPPVLFAGIEGTSLRNVPQFPGGLLLRALEEVLGGHNGGLLSPKASIAAVPEHNVAGGSGVRRRNTRACREPSIESSQEKSQRREKAIETMQQYLQDCEEAGSIFIMDCASELGGGVSEPGGHNAGAGDDPVRSVDGDGDETGFTLNEPAHVSALLRDLHLQFNDVRHAKYSTMLLVHFLQGLKTNQAIAAAAVSELGGGAVATGERAESAVIWPQPAASAGSMAADLAKLAFRKKQNLELAAVKMQAHTCNSCREKPAGIPRGKFMCDKRKDLGYNCPVRCFGSDGRACGKDDEDDAEWVMCPWCCSWQHLECVTKLQLKAAPNQPCYDSDMSYLCFLCASLPTLAGMRRTSGPRTPPPPPQATAADGAPPDAAGRRPQPAA